MAVTTGRTWEEYLDEHGQVTEVTDKDFIPGLRILGLTAAPNSGENIMIPASFITLYKRITVTAAQLKVCGTTPVTILAAPGVLYFHSVSKVIVTRAAGGVAYAFDDYLKFGSNGGDDQFVIDNGLFNITGQLNLDLVKQGQKQISNVAYLLSLIGGAASDSATGDKDIDIEVYYSINQVKV